MKDCNAVSTPLDKNQILTHELSLKTEEERKSMKDIPYREVIGCIIYAQLGTRPDLAHAIGVISRCSNDPGNAH